MPQGCAAHLPSPRVHIYELPHKLVTWPPPSWRHVRALWTWIKASRYNEPKPLCADYFLVPSYPNNHDDTGHDVGDLRMMQLFDYIRMRWPAFNHSIRSGRPNHFMLLPCDHGPGDCGFSRPLKPNKYRRYRDGLGLSNMPFRAPDGWRAGGWIDLWEAINPASPARALILLGYSGWSDQLRRSDGSCLNCYQSGLDVRMPTPEGHECGPLCGMHFAFNETLSQNIFLPVELQRLMLLGDAKKSSALVALGPSRRQVTRPKSRCFFSWAGAVRGRNNPSRSKLLQLRNMSGMCITNTIEKEQQREQERQKRIREGLEFPPAKGKHGSGPREKDEKKPSISDVMLHSRFCFSPLGWDQGDSDRYLPALFWGCVPIMSDRLEGMPLEELPDLDWNSSALAIEHQHLMQLPELLQALPEGREAALRAAGSAMVPRMLYTTFEFSDLPGRSVQCAGWAAVTRARRCVAGGESHNPACHEVRRDPPWMRSGGIANLKKYLDVPANEPICGRTSYFGEDGSRDAFEGLMEIFRRRMSAPPPPAEPWNALTSMRPGSIDLSISEMKQARKEKRRLVSEPGWYEARVKWYKKQLAGPSLDLLRAVPPSREHRRALAVSVGLRSDAKERTRVKPPKDARRRKR